MHRAYSLISIKDFDGPKRTFTGIATHPEVDRMGDVIEPGGVKFAKSLPLLLYHDSKKPVGEARFGRATKDGIAFDAVISTVNRPGAVNDRINEAIDSLNANPPLIRAVSIGFRPLEEPQYIKETGGFRFKSVEVLELSMVVVPAHQLATIDLVKSLDAASGSQTTDVRHRSTSLPAPAGLTRAGTHMPPISEQLTVAQAELLKASNRFDELDALQDSHGELEADDATELKDLTSKVTTLSDRVDRLKVKERAAMSLARPAVVQPPARETRDVTPFNRVETKSNLEPGIEFARYMICRMAALKFGGSPMEYAKEHYPDNPRIQWMMKDNIAAASTQDNIFLKPLVNATPASEFIEWLRPQTLLGRIPGLTPIPFNTRVTGQTSGATGYWVGEGKAKPLTRFGVSATTLTWAKVAAIIALTDEVVRFSSPSAELLVRRELAAALKERLDIDFVDPSKAAVANVSPASITNGVTSLNDSGTSLANVMTDVAQFFNAMLATNVNIAECVWLMPNTVALQLSMMLTSTGVPAFPTINITGGTWQGLPVVTSQYLLFSHTPANNKVILVHAPSIGLADDGGFTVDISREASLEMDDQPVMETGALGSPSGPTGSALVSMFQTNSMAIRCERYINWARLRTGCVVWMDDVRWAA